MSSAEKSQPSSEQSESTDHAGGNVSDEAIADMDSTLDADEQPTNEDILMADLNDLRAFELSILLNPNINESSRPPSELSDRGMGTSSRAESDSSSSALSNRVPQCPLDWHAINHREVTSEPSEQELLHKIFKYNRMFYYEDSLLLD